MATFSINNTKQSPIHTRSYTSIESLALAGVLFYVSTGVECICPNSQLIIQLGNPANSGIHLCIHEIFLSCSSYSTIELYNNLGFSEQGNELRPVNANTFASNESTVKTQSVLPTKYLCLDENPLCVFVHLPGTLSLDIAGSILCSPGSVLTIAINSKASSLSQAGISVCYSVTPY